MHVEDQHTLHGLHGVHGDSQVDCLVAFEAVSEKWNCTVEAEPLLYLFGLNHLHRTLANMAVLHVSNRARSTDFVGVGLPSGFIAQLHTSDGSGHTRATRIFSHGEQDGISVQTLVFEARSIAVECEGCRLSYLQITLDADFVLCTRNNLEGCVLILGNLGWLVSLGESDIFPYLPIDRARNRPRSRSEADALQQREARASEVEGRRSRGWTAPGLCSFDVHEISESVPSSRLAHQFLGRVLLRHDVPHSLHENASRHIRGFGSFCHSFGMDLSPV
mmetsp:Transcript_76541/g.159247  ORF Transcript_76541/g.159247 Transcript_76541/m.159247 type:complete len:276 (+) Transcript_76541:6979-7806(+)